MAELKTQRTKARVADFLESVPDPQRKKDAKALATLMRKTTGTTPAMWGTSIVGYGVTTYQGSRGKTVDWFRVGFSPRKAALVVYLMGGLQAHTLSLARLGPHKIGGGCLYLARFAEIDREVLANMIATTYALKQNVTG
jgi:hypothetical protein